MTKSIITFKDNALGVEYTVKSEYDIRYQFIELYKAASHKEKAYIVNGFNTDLVLSTEEEPVEELLLGEPLEGLKCVSAYRFKAEGVGGFVEEIVKFYINEE